MADSSETLSPALPPDVEQLALDVLKSAVATNQTLATAESCTGGLFASLLTDVEGCGHCFDRGFVAYTENAKADLLGVSPRLLERESAVSFAVAEAMVLGALSRSDADVALAITGYAGAGEPGTEPGLVYIAVGRRGEEAHTTEHHFGSSSRGEVRISCLRAGLEALLAVIREANTKTETAADNEGRLTV